MKKLLLGLISTLLLASTSAQAVVYARQLWQHPNGKIVEGFSDLHKEVFYGADPDYSDLLESVDIAGGVHKQQQDIIKYAKLFGDKAHIFVEDRGSSILERFIQSSSISDERRSILYDMCKLELLEKRPQLYDTLALFAYLCEINHISVTNIESRTENACIDAASVQIDKQLLTQINNYDDGSTLNSFYKKLKETNCSTNTNIMDISVIHTIYEFTHHKNFTAKDRIIIIAGGAHIENYYQALALMGYKRIENKIRFHPETHHIIDSSTTSLEKWVKKFVTRTDLDLIPIAEKVWSLAFLVTHPLDIAQIIEEERKELVAVPVAAATHAETKEIAALRMAAPVVVTPVIRSRL